MQPSVQIGDKKSTNTKRNQSRESKRYRTVTTTKWSFNYLAAACKLVKDTSEKVPEALAQREARNLTLSHKRRGSMHIFLKMSSFLSIQITHRIAKMTHSRESSSSPHQNPLYQCVRKML